METDLIFNRGIGLAEFASFPLVESDQGRALLRDYYDGYAAVARRAGAGLTLESPTWRANPDWGRRLGYDHAALDRVNRAAIEFLDRVRESYSDLLDVRIIGAIGPRGDGYVAGAEVDPDEAADYHRLQVEAFAAAGVDVVAAYTITSPTRAWGSRVLPGRPASRCWWASRSRPMAGCRTGHRCATRWHWSRPRSRRTDSSSTAPTPPTSHPRSRRASGCGRGSSQVNPNASTLSHAELDEAEELDAGDLGLLTSSYDALRERLPGLTVVGGCCGTDARHIAALWGV